MRWADDTLPAPDTPNEAAPRDADSDGSPDLDGTVLAGRYRVLGRIGAGGMGTVYLVEHIEIRRRFAAKLLNREISANRGATERFLQEARTASAVRHPHVIEIIDFGHADDGSPFFVMELLDGEDLAAVIASERTLPWARTRIILLQILAALTAAHERGIIHRDIKPQNCFCVERYGSEIFIKVLDFGIATSIHPDTEHERLTRTGTVVGTAHYMSPEQARSEVLDARADIYAVGVIGFELLTGQVPYQAPGFLGVLSKLLTEAIPSMASVAPGIDIHPEVERLIRRAMAKRREERYASAAEFAMAIERLPADFGPHRRTRRRVWLTAGTLALAAAGAVAAALAHQPDPTTPAIESPATTNAVRETTSRLEPSLLESPPTTAVVDPAPQPKPSVASTATDTDKSANEGRREDPASGEVPPSGKPTRKPSPHSSQRARADAPADAVPDRPAKSDIEAVLGGVKVQTRTCGEQALVNSVDVKLQVSPAGTVERVDLDTWLDGTSVARCVRKIVEPLVFPASRLGFTQRASLPIK